MLNPRSGLIFKKNTLFIVHCSSSTTAINNDASTNHSSALTNHSSRPTTEKTATLVHRSTSIYYLRHRPAATTRSTPQETLVDFRLQQPNQSHKTTSHSHPQTHHSQHRLVIHSSKGRATYLYLQPSTVPLPSAATTDPHINRPSSSSDTTTLFIAPPIPNRITEPRFLRHRCQ